MNFPRAIASSKTVCCAVTRCQAVVGRGKLMCYEHWQMIPAGLQREIGHFYRSRQMGNYQSSLSRALDHVEREAGIFTGVFEKRADRDLARVEGGGFDPLSPPSDPIDGRARRPRLTVKRLAAIEEALAKVQQLHTDYSDALQWVRFERAKRRARKAVRA